MIRFSFFILFTFGIFVCNVYWKDAYKSKLQTRMIIGANIPITKLFQGTATDYLLKYEDYSYFMQIPSISFFFNKHLGFEFNIQLITSDKLWKWTDNFSASLQAEYGNRYYVYPRVYDSNNNLYPRIFVGLIYRFEINKLYVYPKCSLGVTWLLTDWGRANLKEKNSNNEFTVSYLSKARIDGKERSDYIFSLFPSVSFGYKILNRLYLNTDIMLSYSYTNVVFEKEFTNLYSKESTVENILYKKSFISCSFGAGLIYVIH